MFDTFNRDITYLRISVTDQCNLRCYYCMPEKGRRRLPPGQTLSCDAIVAVVQAAVEFGITKLKLTGGEPLVRKDLVTLVAQLKAIAKVREISMTTNGILLKSQAQALAQAGLDRVNISLDTLDPGAYRKITRGGKLQDVLTGIQAAKAAGLTPIKLNCVLDDRWGEPQRQSLLDYATQNDLAVQFIRKMDLSAGVFYQVEGGHGGNCACCNRLRLTSNGIIKPCLFSDLGYSIYQSTIGEAIRSAIRNKPRCGERSYNYEFYNVGG